MKVEKIKKIEGCLEGTNVKDVLLTDNVDKAFVDYLAALGKLIFFEGSGKPFYKVIIRGQYSIKGAIGNHTCRLILPTINAEEMLDSFIHYVNSYPEND
jgi:hypothetical protein